jgi:hypothetical protein
VKGLFFRETGSLDLLRVEELPLPVPKAGEVLVIVLAAAVNPSDTKETAEILKALLPGFKEGIFSPLPLRRLRLRRPSTRTGRSPKGAPGKSLLSALGKEPTVTTVRSWFPRPTRDS